MRLRLRTWVLVVAISGCSDIVGGEPLEFEDAENYFIEPKFRMWCADLEKCSGLERQLGSIRFYSVPVTNLRPSTSFRTVGIFFPATSRIFVIESEKRSEPTIRHEMMHALLRDTAGHPPEYFGETGRCGFL